MAEEKKISIEKMDEIIRDYYPDTETVDFHGQELVVSRTIPFRTEIELVNSVIDACFDEETGAYLPEYLDFAMTSCIVAAFTNVRLPQDAEHRHRILYGTNLMEFVEPHISETQICAIECAIRAGIRARNDANVALFESRMNEASRTMLELSEKIAGIFDGVSKEDISAVLNAVGNGTIDEEKIARAVVREQNLTRGEEEENTGK